MNNTAEVLPVNNGGAEYVQWAYVAYLADGTEVLIFLD